MPFEISANLVVVICILSLLFIFLIFLRVKHRGTASYKIEAALRPYTKNKIHNLIIPDGIEGLVEVEQLILTEFGLLIIETYPVSGNLFGADKIDQWTQIVGGRSFKFINPLRRIHDSRHALKLLVPKTPIFCRVIFSADSYFPKGKPEEVSTLITLAEDIQNMKGLPKILDKSQQEIWDKIVQAGQKNEQDMLMGD